MVDICRNISNYGHTADSIYNVYIVQVLWSEIPVSKVNSILAKLLLINKTTETEQPALAQQVTDNMDNTFDILDQRLIQIVLTTMELTFTCYLFIKLILWVYDFVNTKFLHLNSIRLSYWKTLTMDKTNIYLHLYHYTTGGSINLYLGTIFGQPENITCEGQFVLGTICLDQNLLMIS